MKKLLSVLIIVLTFALGVNAQMTLNGVTLPAELSFNEQSLALNGGGVRSKFFFKLYTIGLYLPQKSSDGNAVLRADETMAIRLEITSSMIDSDNMSEAINEGFDKSTGGNTTAIRDRINELLKTFSSEAIRIGDVFDLVYVPGIGVQAYKNSSLKCTLAGLDFKQALFGIWLSDNPITEEVKSGMLGK